MGVFTGDVAETVNKSIDFADNSFESRQELRETAAEIHAADMRSDNQLSKLIRPIITLTLLGMHIIMLVVSMFGIQLNEDTFDQNALMLGAAITFYFGSKAWERVTEKKVLANIRTNQDRNKAVLEEKRIIMKQEVKDREQDRKIELKEQKMEIKNKRKPFFKRNR